MCVRAACVEMPLAWVPARFQRLLQLRAICDPSCGAEGRDRVDGFDSGMNALMNALASNGLAGDTADSVWPVPLLASVGDPVQGDDR